VKNLREEIGGVKERVKDGAEICEKGVFYPRFRKAHQTRLMRAKREESKLVRKKKK